MATAAQEKTQTTEQAAQQQGSPPAKAQHPLVAFKQHVESRMSELAYALPPHISPERFTRVLLTALQRNAALLKCTRQSLWNACLLAAQDGLLPDGREGAIVPYGQNENGQRAAEIATWMPMIEGLRKKARNSGEISNWEAHIVYARDAFEVVLGDAPRIDHKPYVGPEERGQVVAAYSIAWLKDGTISREVMTKRELDQIKAKSRAKNGPWADQAFIPEMYRKTVARRHYKQLPHSSDLDTMIARDDEAFGLGDRAENQIEQRQQRRIASVGSAFDQFAAGAGPVIDHEPSGTQDEPPAGEDFGEFEDAPTEAKTAGDGQPANEPKGESEKNEQPKEEPKKPAAWPLDKKPTNAEEYQKYVSAKVDTINKDTVLNIDGRDCIGGEAIATWFKSPAERKLRNECGVQKEGFDDAKIVASERINKLNKGG